MNRFFRCFLFHSAVAVAATWTSAGTVAEAAITHRLKVEIVQVCNDDGTLCTPLDPGNDVLRGYAYESQVNAVWAQAGIGVDFTYSTWNNTQAQRLTSAEMSTNSLNDSTLFGSGLQTLSGDPQPVNLPGSLQYYFVMDHPGTGYTGDGTGWVDNPLGSPMSSARSAGIAQLYIHNTFASNGRAVMANEGFTADSLSGVIAHEIGHSLGLRHVEDINAGEAADTIQDPAFMLATNTANLMWGFGSGPNYDPNLFLTENFALNQQQIDAAIFNGTNFDIGGQFALTAVAVPEPTTLTMLGLGTATILVRRHRLDRRVS